MDVPGAALKNNVTLSGNPAAQKSLVFIHGFGTDQSAWDSVVPAFEATHRIVRFDNLGAGGSDRLAFVQHKYLRLGTYANDLIEICKEFSVTNACLIGHSAGAMIGALASIGHEDIFTGLVMLAASPRYLDDVGYIGGFTQADLNGVYSAMMNNFPAWAEQLAPLAVDNPDRPDLVRYFASTLAKVDPAHALTLLCSILQSDFRQDIPKIAIPTLILQSTKDYFVPPQVAEYLHEQIAGSVLREIECRGHFPHLSAPDAVIAAIREFIGSDI